LGKIGLSTEELARLEKELVNYIRTSVGNHAVVIGLSGGVDSSVCAALAVRAIGPEKVLGVHLPTPDSCPGDQEVACEVAGRLGIALLTLPLDGALEAIKEFLPQEDRLRVLYQTVQAGQPYPEDLNAYCELKLRLRGTYLRVIASEKKALLCQTLNLTELLMDWYSIHGDAEGNLGPLMGLLKSHVFQLALALDLPDIVLARTSGHGNLPFSAPNETEAYGLPLRTLDYLILEYFAGRSPGKTCKLLNIPEETVQKVFEHLKKGHAALKERLPLLPKPYIPKEVGLCVF